MSDIDDLAEIAEQSAFGFRGMVDQRGLRQGRNVPKEACGGGHIWTDATTRWHKDKRGRFRRTCRICDKNRATYRRNAARMPTA